MSNFSSKDSSKNNNRRSTRDRNKPSGKRRSFGNDRSSKKRSSRPEPDNTVYTEPPEPLAFKELALKSEILKAVENKGYTHATPIQTCSLPPLLKGKDFIGQAQTGTGKTAAFALPILNQIKPENYTQCLILAPTRELAGQVAEALEEYSKYLNKVKVLPIYGGTGYNDQIRGLRAGPQIVVGTPGRIMDHLKNKVLKLDRLETLVLDEADEMLRMGFIEDIEWILEHAPKERQTVLFSATMPASIKKVADKYLTDPEHVHIRSETQTSNNITQRYLQVKVSFKLDALWRILETENYDAVMIFTKTKIGTHEVAEFLNTKGIKADALNGDLPQDTRERLVDRLKSGHLDVIAATDVAARGLDVNRITHVINYDMPSDIESYVHRIGRTGRAGRQGDSISLITPRQKRFLEDLQDHTGAIVEKMILPTLERINTGREKRLEDKIKHISENEELDQYQEFIQRILVDLDMEPNELAAHLLKLQHGEKDLWLKEGELEDHSARSPRDRERGERRERGDHGDRNRRERGERGERGERKRDGKRDRDNRRDRSPREDKEISDQATPLQNHPDVPMERFQLGVGYQNQVKPGQIVGAIANEAELDSEFIGHIEISETFSTVDLPAGMPKEVMNHLKKTQVNGQKLEIQKFTR